jgi:hypothetical protein
MWVYYVFQKPDGSPRTIYRMTSDGRTCEEFSWGSRNWIPDERSALVGYLVKGEVYLVEITEAEAEKLKKRR